MVKVPFSGMRCQGAMRRLLVCASWLSSAVVSAQNFWLGCYGPWTGDFPAGYPMCIAAWLELQKNFDSSVVTKYGPPILQISNPHPDLAKIFVQIGDSSSDLNVGMKTFLSMVMGNDGYEPIKGVVGGYHSGISTPIQTVAAVYKIPQVSWGSTSGKLSNTDRYPYFWRTIPPDNFQAKALWRLIKDMLIPAVLCAYQVEEYGEGLYNNLREEAQRGNEDFRISGVGFKYMKAYDIKQNLDKITLVKASGIKFIFLSMTPGQYNPLTPVLQKEGMMSSEYHYLSCEALALSVSPELTVGTMIFTPVSTGALFPKFEKFYNQLKGDNAAILGAATKEKYKVDHWEIPASKMNKMDDDYAISPFIIDTVFTFVHAINDILNAGTATLSTVTGEQLKAQIIKTDFEGVSGQVAFDVNGDRSAAYRLKNVQISNSDKVMVDIGIWSAGTDQITWIAGEDVIWSDGEHATSAPASLVGCPAGKYRNPSTLMCLACPAGTISVGGTVQTCDPCPAGTMANLPDTATSCIKCTAGSFSAESRSIACPLCQEGTYSEADEATKCTVCQVGSYSKDKGSTSCTLCNVGKLNPKLYSTLQKVAVYGKEEWVPFTGATAASSCGCTKGAWEEEEECVPCGKGLECAGMGDLAVVPGYFTTVEKPGSVWRCIGNSWKRCPGGEPGTCAEGRNTDSLTCWECKDGLSPSGDAGHCKECKGSSYFGFVLMCVLVIFALVGVYIAASKQDPTKRRKGLLIVAIACSQCITIFQQIGVFSSISLTWESPFVDILEFLSIFKFEIDYLYVDCVATMDPAGKFVLRMCIVFLFFAGIAVVHFFYVLIRLGGQFSKNWSKLYAGFGTVLSAFFISIVSSMLAPFQCKPHPNGFRTVNEYPSIVCFNDDFGTQHGTMVALSLIAVCLPMSFVCTVIYVVRSMPKQLANGDPQLLNTFAFLFFRFKPDTYWYVLIFTIRNLLVSLVPAIEYAYIQILSLQIIMMPTFAVTIYFQPWASVIANILDIACSGSVCMLLVMFALFTDDADAHTIAVLCSIIIVGILVALVIGLVYGACVRFLWQTKPFQFFICHHKASAGNFARLLKVVLQTTPQVTGKVFMDSDDLNDLGSLFGTVASDTEVLVVTCSKEILSRPWCVGEITTANINDVTTVRVDLPEFTLPSEEYIIKFDLHVPEVAMLSKHGITLPMVQDAMRWLRLQKAQTFPPQVINETVGPLALNLAKGDFDAKIEVLDVAARKSEKGPLTSNAIVADMQNSEAASTAIILQRMAAKFLANSPGELPTIVNEGRQYSPSVSKVVLICSNGVFDSLDVIRLLLESAECDHAVLPVVSEANFRFPTPSFLEQLQVNGEAKMKLLESSYSSAALVAVVQRVFSEIAIELNPQDSEEVVKMRVKTIITRLNSGVRKLETTISKSTDHSKTDPPMPALKASEDDELIMTF